MENRIRSLETPMSHPKCLARTRRPLHTAESNRAQSAENNFFRSAEWTSDGTTIITTSSDNTIHTFIVPPDLLEERGEALVLDVYSELSSREPVNAVTTYPLFDLQNTSTTLILSSVRDHPIRLMSALTPQLVASYPLMNPQTEAYITPSSLLFSSDGTRFIAGSDSLISIFDVSRPGQEASLSLPTGSKKKSSLISPGMQMTGVISALAVEDHSGILAAGTFTRHVGLYESRGMGECVGIFTVYKTEADKHIGGRGVTQLAWSPCGRYLYIVERKSDGVMIYDIRQTGQLVAWLEGRKAMTNQRLQLNLNTVDDGHEIWAGGTDGVVRMWKNPQNNEGPAAANFEWTMHEEAVAGVVLHRGGGLLGTIGGERHFPTGIHPNETASDETDAISDPRLKLWSL